MTSPSSLIQEFFKTQFGLVVTRLMTVDTDKRFLYVEQGRDGEFRLTVSLGLRDQLEAQRHGIEAGAPE